jgi:hypothetical protein
MQPREPWYRDFTSGNNRSEKFNVTDPYHYDENNDTMVFSNPELRQLPFGVLHQSTWDSAAGLIASAPAVVRFMKYFWLNDNCTLGEYGKPIVDRAAGCASHTGLAHGARSYAQQFGTPASCYDPNIGQTCGFPNPDCAEQNFCGFNNLCGRKFCNQNSDCPDGWNCALGTCGKCSQGCGGPYDADSVCLTRVSIPEEAGVWTQVGNAEFIPAEEAPPVSCELEPRIDAAVLLAQRADAKDREEGAYGRLDDFIQRAACLVDDWPGPIPPCPNPPCNTFK